MVGTEGVDVAACKPGLKVFVGLGDRHTLGVALEARATTRAKRNTRHWLGKRDDLALREVLVCEITSLGCLAQ